MEDWLWQHPEAAWFVDGWIDRQLQLNTRGILDLLGYKKFYDNDTIVLVELKSRGLKDKDINQVEKYNEALQRTIEDIGLIPINIWAVLVGVGTKPTKKLFELAYRTNTYLYDFKIDDGEVDVFQITPPKCYERDISKRNLDNGKYDNLINYLLPHMPDFIQEEYKYNECD